MYIFKFLEVVHLPPKKSKINDLTLPEWVVWYQNLKPCLEFTQFNISYCSTNLICNTIPYIIEFW